MKKQKNNTIKIEPPKGRPLLRWMGQKPLGFVTGYPTQLIETFGDKGIPEVPEYGKLGKKWHNLLFHGDNKEVLGSLLELGFREKVDLIYIDPPFASNKDYVRKVELRGLKDLGKIEEDSESIIQQTMYEDIWKRDEYFQFMYERLILLKELLGENGFICVHMNVAYDHYMKVILDEIFGESNFRNEIIVKRIRKSYTEPTGSSSLNEGCDYLLLYSKSPTPRLRPSMKKASKEERWHSFDAPNIRPNLTYELFGKMPPAGRCWLKNKDEAQKMIKEGNLRAHANTGLPEYKIDASTHISRDTLWDDITAYSFKTGYPTEKKIVMIEALINMCLDRPGLVLDSFMGSGTTLVAAQKLGHKWIGIDVNKGAVQITSSRIQKTLKSQQSQLISTSGKSFAVYKVNNYDLRILKTEAKELAIQQYGITPTKTDTFFDGTRDTGELVKIIDFNHPLTLIDLQLIKDELDKRPDEDRNVIVICLGRETKVDAWVEEWNKKQPHSDAREGRRMRQFTIFDLKDKNFVSYEPSQAEVDINRTDKDKVAIKIRSFISPTIIKRLEIEPGLLRKKIPDFRSMIDVVLVDTDYDGKVFNVVYSDVPEKQSDMVTGEYVLDINTPKVKVAVKIIDMLGEEVLVTEIV